MARREIGVNRALGRRNHAAQRTMSQVNRMAAALERRLVATSASGPNRLVERRGELSIQADQRPLGWSGEP
jgi:hypothetical protein